MIFLSQYQACYADDALLYTIINSTVDGISMQNDLAIYFTKMDPRDTQQMITKCDDLQITNFIDAHYICYMTIYPLLNIRESSSTTTLTGKVTLMYSS